VHPAEDPLDPLQIGKLYRKRGRTSARTCGSTARPGCSQLLTELSPQVTCDGSDGSVASDESMCADAKPDDRLVCPATAVCALHYCSWQACEGDSSPGLDVTFILIPPGIFQH
jgi:hypothetical protein